MILLGLLLLTLLVTIRIRFKVVLNDSEIISTGFFSTKRIAIDEITNGRWLVDDGYPKDRLYGPYVYEIQTATESMRINFKLFPLDCMQTVLKTIAERT